jgi:plastocyanin
MTYRRMFFVLAVTFFATLAVPVVSADTNSVEIRNFAFSPNALTINAGTVVTWKNLDGEPHTVVNDQGLFRSDALDQNDTFTYKFDKAGTYRFICSIHPTMRGTVVVK